MIAILSRRWFIALLLVVITAAVYWQMLDHEFLNFDDDKYVTDNPNIQQGFTNESVRWAFGSSYYVANWHPLTWLSHMLDIRLYGMNSRGHHATNLILHAANVVLLFFILTRMTGAVWKSGLVAALFAVHPLHIESVAWVAERKDVLSTLFWLLTTWAYLYYAARPGVLRYIPIVVLYALGLMAKPMLVTLPFVLLLLDYWPLGRLGHKPSTVPRAEISRRVFALVVEKLPLFALAAASSVVTTIAQRQGRSLGTLEMLPLGPRLWNTFVSYIAYIGKTFWPAKLTPFYPHPGRALPVWQGVLALLVFCALFYLVLRWAARGRPWLTVGWLWYVGTLVPVIGLVQVGGQSMADRYTYVPLIGIFVMLAWGVPDLVAGRQERGRAGEWATERKDERKKRRREEPTSSSGRRGEAVIGHQPFHRPLSPVQVRVLGLAAIAAVLGLSASTWVQLHNWRNSIVLFTHMLEVTRDNDVAHNNLGLALSNIGRVDEAIAHFREAIRINPDCFDARGNMANMLGNAGRYEEAAAEYAEIIKNRPDDPIAHNNLGNALLSLRRVDEALAEYEIAARLRPNDPLIRFNRGRGFAMAAKLDEAIAEYREAIALKPDFPPFYDQLGLALRQAGKFKEAIATYRRAIELAPDYTEAHNNLGNVYFQQRDYPRAIAAYREAIRVQPANAQAHSNLAAALLSTGDYSGAWAEVREARKHGFEPPSALIQMLSQRMPEPR